MNRKLHHTLSALAVAAAFLVLGMAAAVPEASSTRSAPAIAKARPGIDSVVSVVSVPVVSRAGTSTRRQRHRLVMPYFSFSSRS